MNGITNKLDVVERGEWRKQKAIIEKGKEDFWKFIEAIRVVRDKRLYREDYKTFEAFVETQCGLSRVHVHRLMEASVVKEDLLPIGNKNERAAEIKTEGQLRELVDVPKDELEAVVEKAAEIAGDAPITAKVIRQAKEEVLEYEDVPDREPGVDDETPEEAETYAMPTHDQALLNASVHRDLAKAIGVVIKALNAVEEMPGTELLLSRRAIIERDLNSAKAAINYTRPHAVCPRCRGLGCAQCGNHGWVTSTINRELESA